MEKFPSNQENKNYIEVEQKYLLASEADLKNLEKKIKELFPGSKLIVACSETSYYFSKISKEEAKRLCGWIMKGRDNLSDLLSKLDRIPKDLPVSLRFRKRKNHWHSSFVATFKASADPLHDIERIEISTDDISEKYLEGFAGNGIRPESIWHSMRREYQVDEVSTVDVQDVTGYGYTAEIESKDLDRVKAIAEKLGLEPLSPETLRAMYGKYVEKWESFYDEVGGQRHFSEQDWKDIEATTKEPIVKNQII